MTDPVIEFDIKTPLDDEAIRSNIAHALSLGIPSAKQNHGGRKPITLLASGPTSRLGPLTGSAAVNGAIRQYEGQAFGPKFWIACDPQELVADFLPDYPPTNTIYLIATKCHPRVFEKLKGRTVRLWQIDDYEIAPNILAVPTAMSVTLCAINLLAQMGYSKLETYGWDGCFIDDRGYALDQPISADRVTVTLKDKTFTTTHTWAAEAQDARDQFDRDRGHYKVKINGPGLIGAVTRHFGLAA